MTTGPSGASMRGNPIVGMCLTPWTLMWAMEGLAQDAHGPQSPVAQGEWTAPVSLPAAAPPSGWTVGAGVGFADGPLVVQVIDGGTIDEADRLVDDVWSIDLSAAWSRGGSWAIGASAPLFLAAGGGASSGGPAVGDPQIWASFRIVSSSKASWALWPYVDLPGAAAGRLLGDRGVGAGVWSAASLRTGPVAWTADAAAGWRPRSEYPFGTVAAGPWATLGGSARVEASRSLSFGVEGQIRAALYPTPLAMGLPAEVLGTARYRSGGGWWASASAGPGLLAGAGSPGFAARATVGWTAPARDVGPTLTPVGDGVNLRLADPDGRPLRGADVLVGGTVVARSDAAGLAVLPADLKWKRGVTVRASGYLATVVPEPDASAASLDLTVPWAPVPFRLRVTDQEGRAVAAEVTLTGKEPAPASSAMDGGRTEWLLPPGDWTVEVRAPGMTPQTRAVTVPPGRSEPLGAEVILAPDVGGQAQVALVITDAAGAAVEGAEVFIDERPVGTTSTGGRIAVSGLVEGAHNVRVGSDVLSASERPEVVLRNGAIETVSVALPFRTGSVIVSARGPDRAPVDALVRFTGPATLPAMPLGTDGQRVFVLRPGVWQMLVSSAALGLQQREIVIPEVSTAPIEVEVMLQPETIGSGELKVTVVDRDGEPVDAAEVLVDGVSYGQTSTGGTLSLGAMEPGPRAIEVQGERFIGVDLGEVEIVEGYQERLVILAYKPGTVRVQARTPDGVAVNAAIRMAGASMVRGDLGPTGRAFFQLGPGSWQMLASSVQHGIQTRTIEIPEDPTSLVKVDLIMNPAGTGDAGLRVQVVDPTGAPIAGADVLVDGETLGETGANGVVEATGLLAGTHRVDIRSESWASAVVERQKLTDGATAKVQTKLSYAPGTVLFEVIEGGKPVPDAIVRLSGPENLRPKSVDAAGRRQFVLAPGDWQVLVSSTAGGIAQREIQVTADPAPRTEVFDLSAPIDPEIPVEDGGAVLLVRVRDTTGAAVPGADVRVNGESLGHTGRSGAILLSGLKPGRIQLEVTAANFRSLPAMNFKIDAGSQERFATLVPEPIAVDVVTRGPDGAPLDARLTFTGPVDALPVSVGSDGFETLQLPPGHWEIFASAPGLGVRRATVDLSAGAKVPRILFDLETAKVEIGEGSVQILERVHFDMGKNEVSEAEDAVLTEVANTLLSRPDVLRVEIQGHTDTTGGLAFNTQLSIERAQFVREALIAKGVPPERLVARGYGPLRPISDNATDEGRAKNRRVEFAILEMAEAPP